MVPRLRARLHGAVPEDFPGACHAVAAAGLRRAAGTVLDRCRDGPHVHERSAVDDKRAALLRVPARMEPGRALIEMLAGVLESLDCCPGVADGLLPGRKPRADCAAARDGEVNALHLVHLAGLAARCRHGSSDWVTVRAGAGGPRPETSSS